MSTPADKLVDLTSLIPTGMTAADVGEDGVPVLVMRGKLTIAGLELECGVLSNGKRIFFGEGIEQLIFAINPPGPADG